MQTPGENPKGSKTMPKTTPPVQTPGENQPPANEPEQHAAAVAAEAAKPAVVGIHGTRTEDEIVATMKHGDPAERTKDGKWVVPPEYGTFTRPDGTRVTRLADGKVIEG